MNHNVLYDPTPLLDRVRQGRPWHQANGACTFCAGDRSTSTCVTCQEVAEVLGVARETVHNWKTGRSRVKGCHVDALAVRAGTHPGELWPEWWANCPVAA